MGLNPVQSLKSFSAHLSSSVMVAFASNIMYTFTNVTATVGHLHVLPWNSTFELTNSWNFPVTLPLNRTNVPPRLASTLADLSVKASILYRK